MRLLVHDVPQRLILLACLSTGRRVLQEISRGTGHAVVRPRSPCPDIATEARCPGYELEVVAGAGRVMEQIEVIIAECSLYPFQQGLHLIQQTMQHVIDLGFLYDVADVRSRGHRGRWHRSTRSPLLRKSELLYPRRWDRSPGRRKRSPRIRPRGRRRRIRDPQGAAPGRANGARSSTPSQRHVDTMRHHPAAAPASQRDRLRLQHD